MSEIGLTTTPKTKTLGPLFRKIMLIGVRLQLKAAKPLFLNS
jgi:hypothetical protein